ncbi:MAG: hypothetical protein Q8O57_00625, partial [Kiritimatiellota bacterium]|nr:hypothetical protein [Kiritimatiellota bacterium]
MDQTKVRVNEQIGSRNWAGYGVGILRVGGPGHRQELCLTYTRAASHNAQDALGLDCWVDGVPVMRRGGYAAPWWNLPLQWERPEFQALKKMDYPMEIVGLPRGRDRTWSWPYAHSPLCQNTLTVDEIGTGPGWGDNRGYGEVITFKGGEKAGEPGSGFQVLDVRDHYSWSRMNKKIDDFRRTLIGVEGPDGRPYVLDIVKVKGEGRQALYNSAWASAVEEQLPPVSASHTNLANVWFGAPSSGISGKILWPDEWVVFLPMKREDPLLSEKILKTIPERIEVSGKIIQGQKVKVKGNRFDFAPLFNGVKVDNTAYAFLSLETEKDQKVTLGMGADWWLQAWLNGEKIMDTLAAGNMAWPPSISDYRADVTLKEGRNILA